MQSISWRHLRQEGCIANCRSLHALVLLSAAEMSGNCRTRALVRGTYLQLMGKSFFCWPLWATVHHLRAALAVCPYYCSCSRFHGKLCHALWLLNRCIAISDLPGRATCYPMQ